MADEAGRESRWIFAGVAVGGVAAAVAVIAIVADGVIPALQDPLAAWGQPVPTLAVPFLLLLASIGLLAVGGLGWVWQTGGGRRRQVVVVGAVAAWVVVGVGGLVVLGRDLLLPGTARVEGLPGQAEPWSGAAVCRRYRWGSFENTGRSGDVQVPASATGSDVVFDLVLSGVDRGDPNLIAGDARWGWATGASMPTAAARITDHGLRGAVLTRPTPILHRDADPSMISFSWDCPGER